MNILLTGGTGYLGSNILKLLLKDKHNIFLLKRHFSNTSRIDNYLSKVTCFDLDEFGWEKVFCNEIDIIVHCATNYGRENTNFIELIESNIIFPMKLLELATKYKVNCFVNTDTILDEKVNFYSLSKKQFKDWYRKYADSMVCINVKTDHFYGPADDGTKFVTNVIRSLLSQIPEINLTMGAQKRNFIYIDDVAKGFVKIINSCQTFKNEFHEFCMGCEHSISIRELVIMMKKLTNNEATILNFGAIPYRENDKMQYVIDVSEMKKLRWNTTVSLEEGLKRTIAYERNYI